jgi:hypothetical protein
VDLDERILAVARHGALMITAPISAVTCSMIARYRERRVTTTEWLSIATSEW